MSAPDFMALLPLLIPAAFTVLIMLMIAARRSHGLTTSLTALAFALALASIPFANVALRKVTSLIVIDQFALFFFTLILSAGLCVTVIGYEYFKKQFVEREEFYLLLLLASIGAMVLACSTHFASLFLGLELLSVSLYAMIGYLRMGARGVEAGLKYLVLAAASSAFLLFGMALVYARLGTLSLTPILVGALRIGPDSLLTTGFVLILIGVGYKLALVPFHMWTADVYQGAPAPATAFIATVSKGAMMAFLLRFLPHEMLTSFLGLKLLFWTVAIASMVAGNILALLQTNLKRLIAYSSISHLGYMLVAFIASGTQGVEAIGFYLVAYFITILSIFGATSFLSGSGSEPERIAEYRGLAWKRPFLGAFIAANMLSLAGIPLTAGFVAKFYVIIFGVGAELWMLVVVLVLTSAIGLYYYLRVIVALYWHGDEDHARSAAVLPAISWLGALLLTIFGILLIGFGFYPSPLAKIIAATASHIAR